VSLPFTAARKLVCISNDGAEAALSINPKLPALAALRNVLALDACLGRELEGAVLTATGLSLAISDSMSFKYVSDFSMRSAVQFINCRTKGS